MDDHTLITDQIVAKVRAHCREHKGIFEQDGGMFDHEPVFLEEVQGRLVEIVGKLVLSGAPAELARDVAGDVDRLVTFSATVMREAYRELLADLMPAPGCGAPPKKKKARSTKRARPKSGTHPSPQSEGNDNETAGS